MDAERLARFEREAQLLAQLHHPPIASIFGLEESEGKKSSDHGVRPAGAAVHELGQFGTAAKTLHEWGLNR